MTSSKKTQTIFDNCWLQRIPAALLFFAGLAGCNTCVTFISNPPNGTLGIVSSNPPPACTIPKVTMSAVRLRLGIPPACSTCAGPAQVQHIFLTIRGIELHTNASAQNDSPDWQELLRPELEERPLQIDLMERNATNGVQDPFRATAFIPAGLYHQLRLRFVPNRTPADDQLSEENRCGSGTFNCIVMADGSVHPLQLDATSPELRIMPDRMDGAALPFFSDANADLIVEMKLVWELSSSTNGSVQLVPTLTSSARVRRHELNELHTPHQNP